jgi:hypothetical protein
VTVLFAAVVPSAPLLVPALAGGSADADADLRAATRSAVAELTRTARQTSAEVIVVGSAAGTGFTEGTWDWSEWGVQWRGAPQPPLPLALAVGAWLVDETDRGLSRSYLGVDEDASVEECVQLGSELTIGRDKCLLVVGDGSARGSEKAPGYFDAGASAFDSRVATALAEGDAQALLNLDCAVARRLMATGRAAWQVLAAACARQHANGVLLHSDAPYGVGYFVATWCQVPDSRDCAAAD